MQLTKTKYNNMTRDCNLDSKSNLKIDKIFSYIDSLNPKKI